MRHYPKKASKQPVPRRYIVNDSTVEKLGVILENNPQGLLLFRDELSGLFASLNRDDRQQERAFYLEAWNGDGTFSYDRIGRDDVFMRSTTLSMLGGIQPGKLISLLMGQKNGVSDDGLVERLQLAVFPDKPTFEYVDQWPDDEAKNEALSVYQQLNSISYDEGKPIVLKFTQDAQAVFDQWYIGLQSRLSGDGVSINMESHLAKYASLMPSLALIFQVIAKGTEESISEVAAEMAVKWCDVLETHAQRIYSLVDDGLCGAKVLCDRLGDLPLSFKMADLERKRWGGLTSRSDREQALEVLEKHGYLVKETLEGKGRPAVTYHINPKCFQLE